MIAQISKTVPPCIKYAIMIGDIITLLVLLPESHMKPIMLHIMWE